MAQDMDMSKYEALYDDQVTVTVDGTDVVCNVEAIFPCMDRVYISLLPEDAGEDDDAFLFRLNGIGEDELDLSDVEDDEEFDAACDAYDEMLDNMELDAILKEEDGTTEDSDR